MRKGDVIEPVHFFLMVQHYFSMVQHCSKSSLKNQNWNLYIDQSNALNLTKHFSHIAHNKNIPQYSNCSSTKGMSLSRLNIMNMLVITWTYNPAVSWLCDVYPHLLGFAQIDAYFSLLRNPAFVKVLFRISLTDIENSLTHRIVIHDHLNPMISFMLLYSQVLSTVQI